MTNQTGETAPKRFACTECPYIFTEAEVAAEDKSAWGHPCHGVKDEPNTVCESFREPVAANIRAEAAQTEGSAMASETEARAKGEGGK